MHTPISTALQALRHQFTEQLAGRIDAIRDRFERLADGDWVHAEADTLHRLVHGLTGAAGTFGMQSLSDVARRLENQLARLLQNGGVPDDIAWAEVAAGVDRLQDMARMHLMLNAPNLKPPPARARGDRSPLVYLVEDDADQTEHVGQMLREAGYQVRSWGSAEAFRAAMTAPETERPAAVIMDMMFPEGDDAGAALVRECGLGRLTGIPVVVASVRDDLHARLQAFRAGACRYLAKPVQAAALVDLMDALAGRQPAEPYRVLLVDDDPLLLQTHAAILREAGLEVLTLSEPLLTLDRVEFFRPDVLLLDVYMPEASGPELAAVLRERDEHLHLPILFLSAETDMSQQLLALNLGGDDFLTKPIRPEYLVSAVTARARRARQGNAIRLRLQTALYEREREHLALNRHAIVSIAEASGAITYVNDRFCEISGYSRDELLGQNHRVVKSGEHPPAFYHEMWAAISRGQVWQGEICNRRKDGSLYWVESTIVPFVDGDGLPYQYVSIRTDVTHVKAAEAAARASEAMTHNILDSVFSHIAVLDRNGVIVAVNASWQRFAQENGSEPGVQAPHTEVGIHYLDICDHSCGDRSEGAQEASDGIRAVLAGRLPYFRQEYPCHSPSQQRWFEMRVTPLGSNGQGVVVAHTDVTERRLAELAVTESADRLNATLESTKDGILAVSARGTVLFMNRQFREMWRIPDHLKATESEEPLLAHALTQLVDPQGFMRKVQSLYQSAEASEDIIELIDGRVFERYSMPLTGGGGLSGRVWSFHDITVRRHAEQLAEAHKERLRRGQLYANIGTWDWNIQTGELFWTERIAPLFGYPEGDLQTSYENFLNAIHPDDRQKVTDAVNACVERDVPYEIEHRVVWPDGTVRWLLERGAVSRDAAGKPLHMLGVVQDVDDRKRAELALAERTRQLDEAQALAHLGSWRLDVRTNHVEWSDELYRMYGFDSSRPPPPYSEHQKLFAPESWSRLNGALARTVETGEPYELELETVRDDGSHGWMWVRGEQVRDERGTVVELRGVAQDITERKRTELELATRQRQLLEAQRLARLGNWSADLRTGELAWSDEIYRIFGHEPGSFAPSVAAFHAAVHPDDREGVHSSELRAAQTGRHDIVHRIVRPDGEIRHVHELARVERDAAGSVVRLIGTVQDVTEQILVKQALTLARDEAERANRAKSDFLSSMSHELRTPMNAILGFGQLLEYDASLPGEHLDSVREILKAGRHLLDLINEVLDLARIESGNIDLSLEAVEVCPLVDECIGLMTTLADGRGIVLSHDGLGGAVVRADRMRLKQVLLNLLSNAIKYNRDGGSVRLDVLRTGDYRVRLRVTDTGPGIAPERVMELFKPFSRLGAENGEIEGTGIGLTITQRLVEMMGGSIGVESRVGRGSSFWIELPCETIAEAAGGDADSTVSALPSEGREEGTHTILYIEDNPSNLKLVAQMLGHRRHIHLLTAHTPELGIELARACHPDLILLDINMPGMNGYQVLQVLKVDPDVSGTPVVAVTANAMPSDIERGRAAGFADYLTKPLDMAAFLATVDRCLAGNEN